MDNATSEIWTPTRWGEPRNDVKDSADDGKMVRSMFLGPIDSCRLLQRLFPSGSEHDFIIHVRWLIMA